MALLTGPEPLPDPWSSVTRFTGAGAILDAQARELPQPDQLCGPFAARAALHALGAPAAGPPDLLALALASGTRIWPHDEPAARPPGATGRRLGWDDLPTATTPEEGGTDAAGLAAGVIAATGGAVAVVPVRAAAPGPWPARDLLALLADVAGAPYAVGVVANISTGPLGAAGTRSSTESGSRTVWDVGHFVVLWGVDPHSSPHGRVAVADSYAELTGEGAPPGCRLVDAEALAEALGVRPGRGLLLLTDPEHAVLLGERAVELGMVLTTWRT